VVGRMRRAGRVVDKKRPIGRLGLLVVNPMDRLVRQVIGQVVLFPFLSSRHSDDRIVLGHDRIVLAACPAEKSVEVIKAQPARPAVEGAGRAMLVVGRKVPFAEGSRRVAVVLQNAGNTGCALGPGGVVSRPATGEFGNGTKADGVMVAPRKERCAGW